MATFNPQAMPWNEPDTTLANCIGILERAAAKYCRAFVGGFAKDRAGGQGRVPRAKIAAYAKAHPTARQREIAAKFGVSQMSVSIVLRQERNKLLKQCRTDRES